MKRQAQPRLSEEWPAGSGTSMGRSFNNARDISPVTTRNYLSDLRQFIAWCEDSWREGQMERSLYPASGRSHASDALPRVSPNLAWSETVNRQS